MDRDQEKLPWDSKSSAKIISIRCDPKRLSDGKMGRKYYKRRRMVRSAEEKLSSIYDKAVTLMNSQKLWFTVKEFVHVHLIIYNRGAH